MKVWAKVLIGFLVVAVLVGVGIFFWVYGNEMWTDTKDKFNETFSSSTENKDEKVDQTTKMETSFENGSLKII